ncbi:hypothetical protein SCHPADRAFT_382612 [Schizopora paradoxa]|uniref:F-box domain-containing protein n=1 Tax=Schizopora paradoxa TaxID=27342 RepID=A0A0H2RMB1_9AGAM|nr:hypothetical protein SCHPADRAFT_382612 [Schizopora paradoxa]
MEKVTMLPGFGRDFGEKLEHVAKHFADLPSSMEQLTPDSQKILALKQHLQDARGVQRALDSLSNALRSCIPSLESQFSEDFIREKHSKLPDEIFAIIFKFASLDDLQTTIRVSRVCRRFRAISLSIPRLWTTIRFKENFYGKELPVANALVYAERSRPADLKLTVEFFYPRYISKDKIPRFAQSLFSFINMQSLRISNLTLDLEILTTTQDKSTYSKLSLPSLDSFKAIAAKSTISQHCYKKWSIPSLRHLHGVNCMPELPKSALSKVKTFSFEVQEGSFSDDRVDWSLTLLARYLKQLLTVEDLKVDLNCETDHFPDVFGSHLKVDLKSLRSLSVTIQDYKYDYDNTEFVFRMFNYEKLTTISIELPSEILPDVSRLLEHIGVKHQYLRFTELPSLKNLDFRIRPTYNNQYFSPNPRTAVLGHFLQRHTPAESLYFECPEDDHQVFGFSNRLAAIKLKNCQLFEYSYDDSEGPDIVHHLEDIFRQRGELMDRCLVLDGTNSNPVDDAELVRVPISDRVYLDIRSWLSS